MKITLCHRQAWAIDLSEHEFYRLTTSHGVAWVTMEGNPEDFALHDKNALEFTGLGRLVIEPVEYEMEVCIKRSPIRQPVMQEG